MRSLAAIVIFVIGVLAIIAGVMYWTEAANHLPSFFPGYHHVAYAGKHLKRGYAGVGVGVMLILIAAAVAATGGRTRRYSSYR
jgi:heme/copper-type cytochrome/quinol oxidase subunit 1